MKQFRTFSLLVLAWVFAVGMVQGADGWMTDLDAAMERAKDEGKPVMVEFTGSDWCPPCMMMDKKVFSKESFLKGASEKYILVKLDMPNKDKELKAANTLLMKKFKVTGVPTVILFDKDGEEFNRFVASQFPSVEKFLENLDRQLMRKDMF